MADRTVRVVNVTRGSVLAERAGLADAFFARTHGLLGRAALPAGEGLVIRPCRQVHTIGMAFPIVVERPAGTTSASDTRPGDLVALRPLPTGASCVGRPRRQPLAG